MKPQNKYSEFSSNEQDSHDYQKVTTSNQSSSIQPTPRNSVYNSRYFSLIQDQDYDKVPFYRRALVVFLLYLLLGPFGFVLATAIAWSGKVYVRDKKTRTIYTWTTFLKVALLIIFGYISLRFIFH